MRERTDVYKRQQHHGHGHFLLAELGLFVQERLLLGPVRSGGRACVLRRQGTRAGGRACVRCRVRRLRHHLKRRLRPQRVHHRVRPPEVVFPGERRLVGSGARRRRRGRGDIVPFVVLFGERMQRRDLERLEAQQQRLHQGPAPAHERPVQPSVHVLARRQVVIFHVHGARRLAHGHRPVELAPHHDALDERLASHMRLERPVLGERPRKVALLRGVGGLEHLAFPHASPCSRAGTDGHRSSCLRGRRRARRARRRP